MQQYVLWKCLLIVPSWVCWFDVAPVLWPVSHFLESWLVIASLLYSSFEAADNWSQGMALEASPLIAFVNAYKWQLMSPWHYSKRLLEHVLEQTVDLIFFYGHCCWLRPPVISQLSRTELYWKKGKRTLKHSLCSLFTLHSPVVFYTLCFLAYFCRFL